MVTKSSFPRRLVCCECGKDMGHCYGPFVDTATCSNKCNDDRVARMKLLEQIRLKNEVTHLD